ncbi:MAG: hypothetical protein HQ567_15730 [Candidatus Nealsonbacteria bacterium]|nr:hypothetical protein [Candidatus Nealsonbacteria bacterium]
MADTNVDRKAILFEAIRDSLSEVSPDDVAAFEFAYDGMYEMKSHADSDRRTGSADAPALTAQDLADVTTIALAFEAGRFFLFLTLGPFLEEKVLPNLDRYEEDWIERTGQPRLIKSIRKYVERAIRKHLDKPSES